MDKLPHALLLQILSRLDDSADVARCRVASKAFDTVSPDLRSIHLRSTLKWYLDSSSTAIKPFKAVFLDLISQLIIVKSVRISLEDPIEFKPNIDDFCLTDGGFAKEWLPRVSESLKSLSVFGLPSQSQRKSMFLPLISTYCQNLVNLTLKYGWLSVHNMNPMPMLTSLTLNRLKLQDKHLNKLNKCLPNLQVLTFIGVKGLKHPKIHLPKLRTCRWFIYDHTPTLALITPNLIILDISCFRPTAIYVEAPMLSHVYILFAVLTYPNPLTVNNCGNLKLLFLDSTYTGSLLSEFPVTKTVETLTLESRNEAPRFPGDPRLTLQKVFMVFPNVSSLCIEPGAWSELEACLDSEGWELLDGRKGLKEIRVYLMIVDPSLTFSCIARVLDQCVGLSDISVAIHGEDIGARSKIFFTECMARCWPGLKWRWGIWNKHMEDLWLN
ncbi:hypothetical protein SSX86_032673 [Deinandra increscens subsp. villosa]|uniref:F-box domain-containing protein n=1 Tax=Deinandra increscens subsp. villosa TaxID=3103831 RepID=A0AAP0C6T8_9ASTR